MSKYCKWSEDSEGNWDTSCKEMFSFFTGTPKANHFSFCPYCGKPLVQERYSSEEANPK